MKIRPDRIPALEGRRYPMNDLLCLPLEGAEYWLKRTLAKGD